MQQLKELVDCYYDGSNILKEPVGRIGKKELPEEINSVLRQLVDLLLNTKMLCEESKLYITDVHITYDGIAKKLSEKYDRDCNSNTVQTKVWSDKGKIIRFFGENMLVELIEYRDTKNMDRYNESLKLANKKYSNARILSNIALKLPETEEIEITEIKSDDFEDFIETVSPYSKRHMEFISSLISKEAVAYCRYILTATDITDTDIENKNRLLNLLAE